MLRKSSIAMVLAALLAVGSPAHAARMYAADSVPVFNGPSRDSGRMFYVQTASKPMTLDKLAPHDVIASQDGWSQVRLYSKTGWVESRGLIESLPSAEVDAARLERLKAFNEVVPKTVMKALYAGARDQGDTVVFLVRPEWHQLGRDIHEAYAKKLLSNWVAMGAVRNIETDLQRTKLEIRDAASDRILAQWDSFRGYREGR